MRQSQLFRFCIPSLLIVFLFCSKTGHSQMKTGIDFTKDTVSFNDANQANFKFKNDMNTIGRKATGTMTVEVAKLKEIVDACAAKGIQNVKFMLGFIRKEDTAHYSKRNPGLSATDRNDLIGRQQLIIRVPRSAFFNATGRISIKSSSLMTALLSIGLIQLDKPYYDSPTGEDDLYFTLGGICPPPSICN